MSEWKEYKLSDLMEIKYGKDHKHLADGSYPLFGSGGIMRYVEKSIYEEESILIPRKGTLSNLFYVNEPFWSVDTMFWSKVKQDLVLPKYLYYTLKTYNLAELNVGSAVPSLTTEVLNKVLISIPDKNTQTSIAEILSTLDDKIELNNKINQELESLAQTLFKQWFIDFEFPNENGEPYKSSGGEMVDSELGEIPKGWDIDKIAKKYEVSDFVANGSFASLKENVNILEEPSYALFLRNTDSKSNFTNQMRYVDEKTYNFLGKSKIIGNEICISNVADVGTVFRPPSYLNKPMTLGNNLVLFRSNSPNYFYYYFKYFYGQYQIQSITSGSAQLKFNKTDFRNLAIIEVPKGILELFENMISDFTKMQFEILGENVQLTQFRETLLPKLISGELEINEINN